MIKTHKILPYRPCVGIVLINKSGLVFTGERIDTQGAWQMPQGGIDDGETPLEAALRELGEEIGLLPDHVDVTGETKGWITYDLPDHLYGKVWGGKYGGQKQKWFKMRLKVSDADINIETKHPEFARWRWSTKDQLLADIVPFKRSVYEHVVKELL